MRRAISCLLFVVFILVAACSSETENYAPVVNAWTQPAEKQGGYKVQPGDTLYSIAWSYGLDYTTIVDINKLKKPYHVEVGETIYLVAQNDVNAKQTNNKHVKHAVKQQKTLSKINEKEKKTDWRWPTAGQVSQKFSLSAPINKGIDIAGVVGQPIVAASAGVVVYSGNGIPGYGNLIIIKHNSEYLSAYANNKKNLVSENQKVKSGQKIAIMGLGNTGQPALHFEIRFRGKPINPLIKLPKKL